jgi:hypothetical protein
MYIQPNTKVVKAEKTLAKVQEILSPAELPNDLETITDEERFLLRRVGLKMKSFLMLGRLTILLIYFTFQQFYCENDYRYNGWIMMQDINGNILKCDHSLPSSSCRTIQCSGVL